MSRARSARSRMMTASTVSPQTVHTARRPPRSGPERPVRSPHAMLPTAKIEQANARRSERRPSSLMSEPWVSRLVFPQPFRLVLGGAFGDQLGGVERAIVMPVGALDDDLAAVGEGIGHEPLVHHGDLFLSVLPVRHPELKPGLALVVDDAARRHDPVQAKSFRLGSAVEA